MGAANTEANGKLTTTLQADSTAGGAGDIVGTHWGTKCRVRGSADVERSGGDGKQCQSFASGDGSSNIKSHLPLLSCVRL